MAVVAREAPTAGESETPEQKKAKAEARASKVKVAVRAACDELHAIRPQPRADQIELILDQLRSSPDDPPADEKSAKAKAKELFDKAFPAVAA